MILEEITQLQNSATTNSLFLNSLGPSQIPNTVNHSVLLESHLSLGLSLLVLLLSFWQFPSQLPLLALHCVCPIAVKHSPKLCLLILFSLYVISLGQTHLFPWLQLSPIFREIIGPQCPDTCLVDISAEMFHSYLQHMFFLTFRKSILLFFPSNLNHYT